MGENRYLYFPVFVLLLGFFAVLTAKSEQRQDRVTAVLSSVHRELGLRTTEFDDRVRRPERALLLRVAKDLSLVLPEPEFGQRQDQSTLRVVLSSATIFEHDSAILKPKGRELLEEGVRLAGLADDDLVVALRVRLVARADRLEMDLLRARLSAVGRIAWSEGGNKSWIKLELGTASTSELQLVFYIQSSKRVGRTLSHHG